MKIFRAIEVSSVVSISKNLRNMVAAAMVMLLVACASHMATNSTIAEATAVPNGTQVVVTGEVIEQTDREHMLLRDNSGQIMVQVDEDILGKVKLAPDSHLRVYGKMDRTSQRSLLVATSVSVLQ